MILIKTVSGSVFVEGGLERAEHYTQTCIKSDVDCRQLDRHTIQLADDSASELQLMTHLLGDIQNLSLILASPPPQAALMGQVKIWQIKALYSPLEHPPKL